MIIVTSPAAFSALNVYFKVPSPPTASAVSVNDCPALIDLALVVNALIVITGTSFLFTVNDAISLLSVVPLSSLTVAVNV